MFVSVYFCDSTCFYMLVVCLFLATRPILHDPEGWCKCLDLELSETKDAFSSLSQILIIFL